MTEPKTRTVTFEVPIGQVDDHTSNTPCCGAYATYMDDGSGFWVLCCKACYEEVRG